MDWVGSPASRNLPTRCWASPKRNHQSWRSGDLEIWRTDLPESWKRYNCRFLLDSFSALGASHCPASRNHCKERGNECGIQGSHEHGGVEGWRGCRLAGVAGILTWALLLQLSPSFWWCHQRKWNTAVHPLHTSLSHLKVLDHCIWSPFPLKLVRGLHI